jgi:hypothetical protein
MKLERVHNSMYAHDSLGQNTFHFQFMEQISINVIANLRTYLYKSPQLANYDYRLRDMIVRGLQDIRGVPYNMQEHTI